MKESEPEFANINNWGRCIIPNQFLFGVDESFWTNSPLRMWKGQNSNDWYLVYIVCEIYIPDDILLPCISRLIYYVFKDTYWIGKLRGET